MEEELTRESMALCPGVADKLKLPKDGRCKALGSLFWPFSCPAEWFAPCSVQVGRVPTPSLRVSGRDVLNQVGEPQRVAQGAQAAQIGYSTDYLTKRQVSDLYECNEFPQGHAALSSRVTGQSATQVGRRRA